MLADGGGADVAISTYPNFAAIAAVTRMVKDALLACMYDRAYCRNATFVSVNACVQMLGVAPLRNSATVATSKMKLLGEAKLKLFYNDGFKVWQHQSFI